MKPIIKRMIISPPKGFFVSLSGNNNNTGSYANPWRTIQKAADTVKPGDTVYVREGTYYERVLMKTSGEAGRIITFCNYKSEKPIIDLTGVTTYGYRYGGALDTNEKDYLALIGFHIQNVNPDLLDSACGFGIGQKWASTPVGSKHILVKNCSTLNTSNSGIYFIKSEDIHIINCTVDNACRDSVLGSLECVSLDNVNGFVIDNCIVRNCINNVVGKGGEGIDVKTGTRYGIVRNCNVYNLGKVGIYIDGYNTTTSTDIEICNNRVSECEYGINVVSEQAGGLLQNVNVHHNLVDNVLNAGMVLGWPNSGSLNNITLNANTVTNTAPQEQSILIANALATNINITNNILDPVNGDPIYASAWTPAQFTITGNTPGNTVVTP